jgi:hypothetical protein
MLTVLSHQASLADRNLLHQKLLSSSQIPKSLGRIITFTHAVCNEMHCTVIVIVIVIVID